MIPSSVFVPPLVLGAVAMYLGLRGYIRVYLYYVPLSLVIIATLLWLGMGVPPYANTVVMALLAMGLYLCACFGMGWIIHRFLTRNTRG
ncbi:hypothetical protein [Pseudosulfitobacter koreensis]|uniref:Uncharacterized protein n=1 Tax=Pseudosulfitobacter koreensis TaxID=2968472 RepID=A0ABT1YZV1_9RHOB|nr:hypothetical protein [Pseudosulfitobacter koreense]MCR8826387.1 hypothetical protein [Pseudosulfitobacter koreense]